MRVVRRVGGFCMANRVMPLRAQDGAPRHRDASAAAGLQNISPHRRQAAGDVDQWPLL